MRSRVYNEFLTGADADILAGSELEFAPDDGVYVIRAVSTVNTATLAVGGTNGPPVSSARAIQIRANAELRAESDPPWVASVQKGEKVTIALAGTTGTVQVHVTFLGRS